MESPRSAYHSERPLVQPKAPRMRHNKRDTRRVKATEGRGSSETELRNVLPVNFAVFIDFYHLLFIP